MSIYKKLAEARVKLQETDIKKSGFNKFTNFKYFELADFLPTINKINLELGLCTKFDIDEVAKIATLEIFDMDKEDSSIIFTVPYVPSEIKGAIDIQKLGGSITYLRRYLFVIAYEITDRDVVDALDDTQKTTVNNQKTKVNTSNSSVNTKKNIEDEATRKAKCIKAIVEFNLDEDLQRLLEENKIEALNNATLEQLEVIWKELNRIKKGAK